MIDEEKVIEAMKTIKQYCEQCGSTCEGCVLDSRVAGCKADMLPCMYNIDDIESS